MQEAARGWLRGLRLSGFVFASFFFLRENVNLWFAREELNSPAPFRHSGGSRHAIPPFYSASTRALFDRPALHTWEAESNPFQQMSTPASEGTKWGTWQGSSLQC